MANQHKNMDENAEQRLEQLLIEGLDSGEPTEMTKQDWDDVRREALSRIQAPKTGA